MTSRCRGCGHPVIHAVDDHGIDATLDPAPLTAAGECRAVLAGRTTWQVVPASRRHPREVWRRLSFHIGGRTQPGGSLHTAHVCGQPIPAGWAAPAPDHIRITHQPTPGDQPPF